MGAGRAPTDLLEQAVKLVVCCGVWWQGKVLFSKVSRPQHMGLQPRV
ncbi:hypothetical protein [Acetobacter okinawensis]|nr:hypothetical protein [Acetobacter okinawensis]